MPASDILSERDAAHLLRRAGFGASARDLVAFTGLSRSEAVDALLAVKPSAARGPGTNDSHQKARERLQVWWLRRMLSRRYRLQEKMTLFWHDHFPSGVAVVNGLETLAEQNAMFRSYGLGSFRDLVHQVTRDRAMLEYLDGARNRVDEVNENYARELMELFTLGPLDEDGQPNYEQRDVVALARALTGFMWNSNLGKPLVYVAPHRFDDLTKILFVGKPFQMEGVLGVENEDGTQFPPETNVIDGLFAHRDTQDRPTLARFLVRKLWAWFATPEADGALVDALSASFVSNGYMIGELLRALLTDDAFYSEAARSSTPKMPVEFATQALLGLGAKSKLKELPALLSLMGMELFNPPGVEGWQHGSAWLATSRYLARMQLAQAIASARPNSGFRFKRKLPVATTADALVDAALAELGLEVSLETRQSLVDHLSGGEFGSEAWFEMKYRGLFMLLLSLPEFQVH